MINVAKQKASGIKSLRFRQLNIKKIFHFVQNDKESQKFDYIFSNFGGLNCLSKEELNVFFTDISKTLTKNGKITLVIMPKNCIWENKYLLFSGKWKQLFRRNTTDYLSVKVGNSIVKTWYYNPKEIVHLTNTKYTVTQIKPIGFYIPPSYLETFFKNKIWLLNILNWMENRIKNWAFLARYSDHFIITLQKK